jgi:hypothetical protein
MRVAFLPALQEALDKMTSLPSLMLCQDQGRATLNRALLANTTPHE